MTPGGVHLSVVSSSLFHEEAVLGCTGACTLFATHFSRLAELAALYPNCKLWHFGVNASAKSEQLDYTWKLLPGQQQAVHYGLILANSVGIPQQVLWSCK